MITRWSSRLRRFRRWFSQSEWDVRLLGLPRSEGTESAPGLVMIQIDGLARKQLEAAVRRGRMKFVRKLINREGYQLHDFYSGQPASTPAVQGELFYGQKCAVPSFDYFDREAGEMQRMFSSSSAGKVQSRLEQAGTQPLLQGGSAYCDIYSGGAEEVHFCAINAGLPSKRKSVRPLRRLGFALWHTMSAVRIVWLMMVELVIALWDMARGNSPWREMVHELWAVLSRVVVGVVLRELSTIGAQMDIARGLPIIHINFLGYDEQSHRRGPGSAFAHWALRSTDRAIKQLWLGAQRSAHRHYDVWIYSDHGQELDIPYPNEYGRTVEEAIGQVLHEHAGHIVARTRKRKENRSHRSSWLGEGPLARLVSGHWFSHETEPETPPAEETVHIASAGPVGHIYFKVPAETDELDKLAPLLVAEAGIPLVLRRDGEGHARAFTAEGSFLFPEQASEVLGAEHPFLADVARDLTLLCHHPDAGELVLCGFRRDQLPLSFPLEHGSHAGPGYNETHAFALLPADAPLPKRDVSYLRALDLRRAALHFLGREQLPPAEVQRARRRAPEFETIRIMTYNVHSCVGMDGSLSLPRIARVIAQSDADVIALQELDVRRLRTGGVDQAQELAQLLGMEHHFHPVVRVAEEAYGDAILSHLPMRLVRTGDLPRAPSRPDLEPRGVLWVELLLNGQPVQLLNTHLGLNVAEKMLQMEALLGPDWLSHPACVDPLILCGDLNVAPRSKGYRMLARKLRDVQCGLDGHRPQGTFFSTTPFHRIDHIFVSPGVRVQKVEVPRNGLTRVASDHLPVIVTVAVEKELAVATRQWEEKGGVLQPAATAATSR